MITKVRQYIQKNNLLPSNATVIVGLSGGADSVVLLHVLNQLGYHCIAAHCNFHLRNEESSRDEQFAVSFAKSMQVPVHVIEFDTRQYASEQKISIEMAARELRYTWFEKLKKNEQAEAIAVAHHRDDSIETVILNLIRGTGLNGLTGIKPKNDNLVRPLLCLSKEDILEYVQKHDLKYVTDSSNLQNEFVRNKIRNQIIPLFKSINPSAPEAIERTIENLRETSLISEKALQEYCSKVFTKGKINVPKLMKTPSPEAVLFHILNNYQFNRDVILEILQASTGSPGKVFYSPEYRLIVDREELLIAEKKQSGDDKYFIEAEDLMVTEPIALQFSYEKYIDRSDIKKDKEYAIFDAEKLHYPLVLRKWKPGDRFIPFGMRGFKKLSDYFNDMKFSILDKENTWILCSGNDICWIVGHRTDNRFRVDKSTKRICQVKLL